MTYNFDPDKWYDNEAAFLKQKLIRGGISPGEYKAALEDLDRRFEEMWTRLDGSYMVQPES